MKYRILLISILIVALILGYYIFHSYYAPCKIEKPIQLPIIEKDTIQITFIGDSWAFLHKPYDNEASVMLSKMLQQPVRFRSFGICGLTSREIYEQLFSNINLQYFLNEGCHYCVLSAGINDTYKKMSKEYYAQSMNAIIDFLLFNNITPLILEIPDYDIEKCYNRQTLIKKALRLFSSYINQTPIDCKQIFREALDSILTKYKGKVLKLNYHDWNGHFSEDRQKLYLEDGLHLNSNGYFALDQCIGFCMLKQISPHSVKQDY